MVKMYTGWGRNGRAFTREEFKNSYIRRSFGGKKYSYAQYIRDIMTPKGKKLKSALRAAMR